MASVEPLFALRAAERLMYMPRRFLTVDLRRFVSACAGNIALEEAAQSLDGFEKKLGCWGEHLPHEREKFVRGHDRWFDETGCVKCQPHVGLRCTGIRLTFKRMVFRL